MSSKFRFRGYSRRRRLASGIVLFAYILTHLVNHMLGLAGLDVAERGLAVSKLLWRSLPGTIALYGAAALHFALALRTIYIRHDWHLPPVEYLRLAAGFSLPWLLIGHAVSTRLSWTLYETSQMYVGGVTSLVNGGNEGWQLALLAPGWLHGCLGLWISLSRHAAIVRLKWPLLALVVLLPLVSAAGFMAMRNEVVARNLLPLQSTQTDAAVRARVENLNAWRRSLVNGYLLLIASAALAGPVRRRLFANPPVPRG